MWDFLNRGRERCWELHKKYYEQAGYKHFQGQYRETITKKLRPDDWLLDAGCGADLEFTREFQPQVRMAVGVDVDPFNQGSSPPFAIRADLGALPFKSGTFHMVISISVIEHLSHPESVFKEFSRVLCANGALILQTPNKFDYVSLIAHLTPFRFHQWILWCLLGRKMETTFPTHFRANSKKSMRSFMESNGLIPEDILLMNQYPSYFMFSPLLFRLGMLYERLTTKFESLAQLRGWIFAVGIKKEKGGT